MMLLRHEFPLLILFGLSLMSNLATADTARIEVRAPNGKPIEKAIVSSTWTNQTFLTDKKGRVKIRDIPRTSFLIFVNKKGFEPSKKEFDFSRKRERRIQFVLKPRITPPPAPTQPPQPTGPPKKKKRTTVPFDQYFKLYGSEYWKLKDGDGDVWTDSNKMTSVNIVMELTHERTVNSDVQLRVYYAVKELGGDYTHFAGETKIPMPYRAPDGKKIVGFRSGDRVQPTLKFDRHFYRTGKAHGSQVYPTPNGFVKNLNYTIDSFRFDNEEIGVSAMVKFGVVLEDR